jgi:hypothetical protein
VLRAQRRGAHGERKNQITRIVNNYARISFNFGPTLLSWLKRKRAAHLSHDPRRRAPQPQRYRGHSSAMAQVYNHMICRWPSRRDRITQIRWGIADYETSFGSPPEGMWLPETAADTPPSSARRQTASSSPCSRRTSASAFAAQRGRGDWTDTPNATVDTTHPYLVRFDSGALDRRLLLQRPRLARHRL